MSTQDNVREFHEKFGLPVRTLVTSGDIPEESLRRDLLDEEVQEYADGVDSRNIIDIADGLADVVYVAYGTALAYGIDLDAVLAEVHRSNMSKLGEDGKPIYRTDGKVLKGPNYSRPDILKALLDGKPVVEPREIVVGDRVRAVRPAKGHMNTLGQGEEGLVVEVEATGRLYVQFQNGTSLWGHLKREDLELIL